MKYGLVLEGGAMRGLFTAGVLDVLMENGIDFDGAVGVSAGACFGCNYKSRQRGRAIRYNTRFCRDKRYCSVKSLLTTGDMFGADFCYHRIPDELDPFDSETFKNDPMEFFAVCTDVETGKAVYHRCHDAGYSDLEWIRASASMPLAARIVCHEGRKLLDGGISDSIPLRFMEAAGYEKNVVILTRPRSYTKSHSKTEKLIELRYKKYPALVKACLNRPEVYNRQLRYVGEAETDGRAFVIAPETALPISHIEHDQDVLLEVYRTGRMTAKKCLEELKDFLGIVTDEQE
ncbi:MAG: patatin family protein [Ruminococcus sp.]|nr:patatin family protein [Ruminococcus sp.]